MKQFEPLLRAWTRGDTNFFPVSLLKPVVPEETFSGEWYILHVYVYQGTIIAEKSDVSDLGNSFAVNPGARMVTIGPTRDHSIPLWREPGFYATLTLSDEFARALRDINAFPHPKVVVFEDIGEKI